MTAVTMIAGGRGPYEQTHRILGASAAAVSLTGTTSETALATVIIPAGIMGHNGLLRVTYLWTMTSSANVKTPRLRLGGIAGTAFYQQTHTTTATLRHQTEIANRNSAASQVSYPSIAGGGGWSTSAQAVTTGTVNTAIAQDLVISGQLASSGETITLESYLVELIRVD